jgi:hypothetical protein
MLRSAFSALSGKSFEALRIAFPWRLTELPAREERFRERRIPPHCLLDSPSIPLIRSRKRVFHSEGFMLP